MTKLDKIIHKAAMDYSHGLPIEDDSIMMSLGFAAGFRAAMELPELKVLIEYATVVTKDSWMNVEYNVDNLKLAVKAHESLFKESDL